MIQMNRTPEISIEKEMKKSYLDYAMSVIIGRAIQFHATVYGINVLGHLKTPVWADHLMALLTGGEAFHDHHHDQPQSALHRPRKGVWNRIVDYNGTVLLLLEKIGWVRNLKIAPQFA